MSLESVTQSIRTRIGEDSDLNATLKLDLGDDGVVFVDASKTPNEVHNQDLPADCTLKVSLSDLQAMADGDLSPTSAFMDGRLSVDGDLGVAMKLQSLL